MTFVRNKESFVCEHCAEKITGDGYTNHCPKCLVSKHVDRFPGDRASTCLGLMYVTGFETKNGELRMVHTCEKCGHQKVNRVQEYDSREKIAQCMRDISTLR